MSGNGEKETLGEIKIEGCTYKVIVNKSEPGVVELEGVSCDLRAHKEQADKILEALLNGTEVRYRPTKLIIEETSGK